VPHKAIRYILGASDKDRKELCLHPGFPLSYINSVSIENDEDVRVWLLSNQVLEDPLDLLVYWHGQYTADRVPTRPLRRHQYCAENAVANWARQAGARSGIETARKEVRPDTRPANAGCNLANYSPLFLLLSSSSLSDLSDAGEGCEAILGTSPSPLADPTKSPHFRIPLAIQSPSKMNTQQGWDLGSRRGDTPHVKVQKWGAPSDSEDCENLNQKLRPPSNGRELWKPTEDRKGRQHFDDERGDKDVLPVE